MTTLELLQDLQKRDIRLECAGDKLRYDAPKGGLTPSLLNTRQGKPLRRKRLQPCVVSAVQKWSVTAIKVLRIVCNTGQSTCNPQQCLLHQNTVPRHRPLRLLRLYRRSWR